jgi:hypothetical protein
MNRRSQGVTDRKEDEIAIYGGSGAVLKTGDYKNFFYEIGSEGRYPYIRLTTGSVLGAFYGYDKLDLHMESRLMEVVRIPHPAGRKTVVVTELYDPGDGWETSKSYYGNISFVTFFYPFNKQEDFVEGEQSGKKWKMRELVKMTTDLVDKLLDTNDKLLDKKSRES